MRTAAASREVRRANGPRSALAGRRQHLVNARQRAALLAQLALRERGGLELLQRPGALLFEARDLEAQTDALGVALTQLVQDLRLLRLPLRELAAGFVELTAQARQAIGAGGLRLAQPTHLVEHLVALSLQRGELGLQRGEELPGLGDLALQ